MKIAKLYYPSSSVKKVVATRLFFKLYSVRTVEKKILNDSFFNFFNPPTIQEGEDLDSDTEALLDADFQIGSTFKVR